MEIRIGKEREVERENGVWLARLAIYVYGELTFYDFNLSV